MINQDITEIIELIPDSHNLDYDWSWYDKLAEIREPNRHWKSIRPWKLMIEDLVEGSRLIAQYFLTHLEDGKISDKNIKRLVSELFSHFAPQTRENIVTIMKKCVSESTLTPENKISGFHTYKLEKAFADFYHGTGDKALPKIHKHQAILSHIDLEERGEQVLTGENYLGRLNHKLSIICLSTHPAKVKKYAFEHGIERFDDFPIILGFSKQRIDALGPRDQVYTFNSDRDGYEVSLKVPLPISCATHIYAPFKKTKTIKQWAEQNKIENIIPLELFYDNAEQLSLTKPLRKMMFDY